MILLSLLPLLSSLLFSNPTVQTVPAQTTPEPATTPVETELPTDSDRQAAAEVAELLKSLDTGSGVAQELINGHRGSIRSALQTLHSTEPVARRRLLRARAFLRHIKPRLVEAGELKPPPPYLIARRRGKIVIDGKLDEAAWKSAVSIPIQWQRLEKTAEPHATARLLWDSKYLYAAFTVPDSNIIAPVLERDGPVWKYDCVELFLLPDPNTNVYWEIELGPTGSILDYLCYKYPNRWGGDFKEDETMHGLKAVSTIHGTANQEDDVDEGYVFEIAIPFDQLPGLRSGPKIGDSMKGLLCRIDRNSANPGAPTAALAQVPYAGWFHNVWAYQRFIFVDRVPK